MKQVIGYIRVSTDGQRSGNGPDWQIKQIEDYAHAKGYQIVWIQRETHTGNGAESISERPVLQAVLAHARDRNIPILVADIDRLGRHHDSVMELYRSGHIIDVSEGENVDEAVISSKALNAQRRGELIRQTTKEGLAPIKGTGRLGNKTNLHEAQVAGAGENKRRADVRALDFLKVWQEIDPAGIMNRKQLSEALNLREWPTPSGKAWTPSNIRRVMARSRKQLPPNGNESPTLPERQEPEDPHSGDPLWGMFS